MINPNNNKKMKINKYQLNDETKLINYEEAAQIYKSIQPKEIGPEETILMLLAITPTKPIKGKTMIIKQLFLIEREIFQQIQDLKFVGHKFGPHSFLIENILKNMEFIGLIKKSSNKYRITDKGLKKIRPLMERLDSHKLQHLKNQRIAWDELGSEGLIHLVYDKYPEFTDQSIIKYRYHIIDWIK